MCSNCKSDEREIWGHVKSFPELSMIAKGNYILLSQCKECKTLWVKSPYEPYLSFTYLVKWKYEINDWNYLVGFDNPSILLEWHKQEIQYHWLSLPTDEKELIEAHRKRTYYNGDFNPIDSEIGKRIDVEALLKNHRISQYSSVKIVKLIQGKSDYNGWNTNKRLPKIGDTGTVVEILEAEGNIKRFVVECIDRNGLTIWLSDFCEEIEIYSISDNQL